MSHDNDLQHMPVGDLAQRCAQETHFYFQKKSNDSVYCLELFRRAVVSRDNEAWEAIFIQYQPQVERWVYKHPSFPLINEEADDFTMQSLERFVKYFTAEKFRESQSLAAVLNYLQMCVNGVILDCWRKMRHAQLDDFEEDTERKLHEKEPSIEERTESVELWNLVRTRLKDQKERALIYASIILVLSPREIFAEYPNVFRDISEIYQCKANVFARLARDPEIKKFLRRK